MRPPYHVVANRINIFGDRKLSRFTPSSGPYRTVAFFCVSLMVAAYRGYPVSKVSTLPNRS